MNESVIDLDFFHQIHLGDFLQILSIALIFWIFASFARWFLKHVAEIVNAKLRLKILRLIPWIRLGLAIIALFQIVPILFEPSFQNILALVVSSSLLMAFIFKDYASSVIAGFLAVAEDIYQLGDWVEIDGSYGEIILINPRAIHLLTSEDNEVVIPNYQLWTKKVSNATSGNRSMLCVADFYLHPDHDGFLVLRCLNEVGKSSIYRAVNTKVAVVVQEQPWGTHYKIKAYVRESRDQFTFITDMTIRGKQLLKEMNVSFVLTAPELLVYKT